jgi:murein DD-endopeptidase MepM/ murein hydrolase activator NlpD
LSSDATVGDRIMRRLHEDDPAGIIFRTMRLLLSRTVCTALVAVAVASPAAAQQETPVTISWTPQQPRQGSAVQIVVLFSDVPTVGDSIPPVRGHLAGQQLHFERTNRGLYRAIGAIPVSATTTIPLLLELGPPGEGQDRTVRIPVTEGEFTVERLSVAPQYVSPPDSALRIRIAEERARAGEVSRRTHATRRLWQGTFAVPVDGRVTSPFGKGREFNGVVQSRHMGTDLSGITGTPVRAPNRGVVALTGDFYYAGRVVYLDHGAGLITVYMHLSEIAVTQGDTVETGQLLGRVGATGRVTGPHLHWTARYGSVSFDPLSLFTAELEAFQTAAP